MTWNSSCSIASDDENSRHSFLSDCDSEFDLKPPPRYPAEKRSYSSTLNRQSINRIEPPLTRSRAKAIGNSLIISEPLPKQRRQSAIRRSMDAFTEMATTLSNSLNNNSILFPKQEPLPLPNDRVLNLPVDGVNILADRFESCSLDEAQLNKNCFWPSRETNSHYMRPITSLSSTHSFGATPFSTLNNSTVFAQPSTSTLFGQQHAQLWSRFRFVASTLRDSLWIEQTDSTLQQVPSNTFASNHHHHHPFHFTDQSSILIPPQTVPTRSIACPDKTPSSSIEESSSSLFRQRKNMPSTDSISSISTKEDISIPQSSISKLVFTLMIFAIGLMLGYLLTKTLPPGLVWKICVKYFHYLYVYLQTILKYFCTS